MGTINAHQQLWLDALRSGDFEQGQGVMRRIHRGWGTDDEDTYEYCCMGVACELASVEFGSNYGEVDSNQGVRFEVNYNPYNWQSSFVPEWLAEFLGLSDEDQDTLVLMNDTYGDDFNQIADVLEYAWNHNAKVKSARRELFGEYQGD